MVISTSSNVGYNTYFDGALLLSSSPSLRRLFPHVASGGAGALVVRLLRRCPGASSAGSASGNAAVSLRAFRVRVFAPETTTATAVVCAASADVPPDAASAWPCPEGASAAVVGADAVNLLPHAGPAVGEAEAGGWIVRSAGRETLERPTGDALSTVGEAGVVCGAQSTFIAAGSAAFVEVAGAVSSARSSTARSLRSDEVLALVCSPSVDSSSVSKSGPELELESESESSSDMGFAAGVGEREAARGEGGATSSRSRDGPATGARVGVGKTVTERVLVGVWGPTANCDGGEESEAASVERNRNASGVPWAFRTVEYKLANSKKASFAGASVIRVTHDAGMNLSGAVMTMNQSRLSFGLLP